METHRSHSLRAQLITIAALLFSTTSFAHSVSLHEAQLFQLTKFSRFDFSSLKGKKFLLVFFQVDCPPCREQLKALNCLKGKKPEIEIVAAGVGEPKELTKEVKRLQLTYPTLESTAKFQAMVDGISSTPVTFLVDEKGMITKREDGTRTCEAWEIVAAQKKI